MKQAKKLILLLAIAFFLAYPKVASAQTPTPTPTTTLTISPAEINVASGETFKVEVKLDTKAEKVSAAEIVIQYDQTKLEGKSIVNTGFLPVNITTPSIGGGFASITAGADFSDGPATGIGTVAELYFKAISSGPSNISFSSKTQVAAVGKDYNVAEAKWAIVNGGAPITGENFIAREPEKTLEKIAGFAKTFNVTWFLKIFVWTHNLINSVKNFF